MAKVQVEIVTPQRKVYQGEVDILIVAGVDGELGVQAGHAPLVTPLKTAPIRLKKGDEEILIAASGGFLEVNPEQANVLADMAELPDEIDVEQAEKSKAEHEQALQGLDKSDPQYEIHLRALERAEVRLKVAERSKQTN